MNNSESTTAFLSVTASLKGTLYFVSTFSFPVGWILPAYDILQVCNKEQRLFTGSLGVCDMSDDGIARKSRLASFLGCCVAEMSRCCYANKRQLVA